MGVSWSYPGFIDEDKPLRIEMRLQDLPPFWSAGDIGPGLLKGDSIFLRSPRCGRTSKSYCGRQ
jgi:hypothetical protein